MLNREAFIAEAARRNFIDAMNAGRPIPMATAVSIARMLALTLERSGDAPWQRRR